MKRTIDDELARWKEHPLRLPLIIRGARQVGKSHSIEQMGKLLFEQVLTVNFEEDETLIGAFLHSKKPSAILKQLEILLGVRIEAGKTLLFLDEIQLCPEAIQSLRFFYEQMPELHVIAAGSLLEFILEDEKFSFPVGRAQFFNMNPLTFTEFLLALNEVTLVEFLNEVTEPSQISEAVHTKLLHLVMDYFYVGGMPRAVHAYQCTNSYRESLRQQKAIIDLYRLDFGKYAAKTQHHYLQELFDRAPDFVAKHFRFSKINEQASNPSRDYKEALHKLGLARLIAQVHMSSANGLPLRTEKNEKKFKLLFLDIGLLQSTLGSNQAHLNPSELHQVHSGVMAEQFVGQQLLACADPYLERNLYFWEREKAGSSAEIDYVVNLDNRMIPIEVKAGKTGRLKSLQTFMSQKKVDVGVRISMHPLDFDYQRRILSIPFYLIDQLPRLLKLC